MQSDFGGVIHSVFSNGTCCMCQGPVLGAPISLCDDPLLNSVGRLAAYDATGDNFVLCTATLGPQNHFVTAAHCLTNPMDNYTTKLNYWMIAFGATSETCYQQIFAGSVDDCNIPSGWPGADPDGDRAFDYAVCPFTAEPNFNVQPETFGGGATDPVNSANIGYPSVIPVDDAGKAYEACWRPYYSTCSSHYDPEADDANIRVFDCSTTRGHSGGPIFAETNGGEVTLGDMHPTTRFVIGIASYEDQVAHTNNAVDLRSGSPALTEIEGWLGV